MRHTQSTGNNSDEWKWLVVKHTGVSLVMHDVHDPGLFVEKVEHYNLAPIHYAGINLVSQDSRMHSKWRDFQDYRKRSSFFTVAV